MKTHVGIKLRHASSHLALYLQVVTLALPILLGTLPVVRAADLTTRSVQISTARPGDPVTHTFSFTVPTTNPIGSISFEYCSNSPLTTVSCVPPTGLNLSSMVLTNEAGNTGFSISTPDSTGNKIVLTRPVSPGTVTLSAYEVGNIINPTTAGQTVFVRMATYSSTDASSGLNDAGSAAFAIVDSFTVNAYVPPFLTFCVGVFVTLNCNSVTGSLVDVGELSTSAPATANLQFSGATNDGTGYTTFITGDTMTSGNNIVTPLSLNSGSVPGTGQFGLNLRANTNPTVGLDPSGAGTSNPTAGYGIPNSFRFVNGEAVTTSAIPTDFKIFTATYIVNVPPNQPPGVYATTMTFTALASF